MESQKPKIAMYVKRPFGEKLNASFDFIKENWKQLFKYSTYLILPICLIQAANFSGLMGSMTDITAMQASGGISDNPLAALGPSFALNYAGVIFFSCLGALLMTSLVYAMVRLYNEREERLNASFDFIKENWKQLFKYSTYLILPICLIQAANFSGLMGSMTDITAMQASGGISDNPLAALGPSFALNYAGVIFFSCLGALLMTSLIYAMVRLYNEREERLNGVVFGDIKSLLLRNIKRLFLMGIACSFLFIFAVIFIVLLAVLTPFTLILTIPLLFAFMVPLALMAPIYLFEDISLGEAFAKTFRLGFATWGGVFLILIVMGIIASVLQGIVSIPWYVIYIVKMIFTMSDGGATSSSVGLNFAQYLFSILMLYGSYLSAIFGIVGLVYQYGHASEVVDSITVESDIDNFDKL